MGKYSNIILTDKDDIIIDSLKHFSINSGSYRNIFAGSKYELPNSDKLDLFEIKDKEEFYRVLENNSIRLNSKSLAKIISSTFTGISKKSILSFENDLNIEDNLEENASNSLYIYIQNIIAETQNVFCKEFEKDYSLSFDENRNKKDLEINFFLDDYYTTKEDKNTFITYRDYLLKLILVKLKKLNLKLVSINDKIKECKEADKYKLYGELITNNLYRIDDHNQNEIMLENYYDNNNLITIPLEGSLNSI